MKEYLGKYSRYRKISYFVLKLLLRPISFHGKLIFDNLTYFKLYGYLKTLTETYVYYFILPKTRKIVFFRLIIHPNSRNKSINFISRWNQVNKFKKNIDAARNPDEGGDDKLNFFLCGLISSFFPYRFRINFVVSERNVHILFCRHIWVELSLLF